MRIVAQSMIVWRYQISNRGPAAAWLSGVADWELGILSLRENTIFASNPCHVSARLTGHSLMHCGPAINGKGLRR